MHSRRLWLVFGLLAACAAGAAVIYKWTDADGVVHYSDQAVPGAERLVISPANTNGMASGPRGPTTGTPVKPAAGEFDYKVFVIASPAKEQVFFADEIVPVRLQLEPGLRPKQSVTWHLNGRELDDQAPETVAFALQALPRGTYAIAATLTDIVTGATQSTDSVTFYVRQPSELSPQHQRP